MGRWGVTRLDGRARAETRDEAAIRRPPQCKTRKREPLNRRSVGLLERDAFAPAVGRIRPRGRGAVLLLSQTGNRLRPRKGLLAVTDEGPRARSAKSQWLAHHPLVLYRHLLDGPRPKRHSLLRPHRRARHEECCCSRRSTPRPAGRGRRGLSAGRWLAFCGRARHARGSEWSAPRARASRGRPRHLRS